jgi:mono/diheme cytochrome c family protein
MPRLLSAFSSTFLLPLVLGFMMQAAPFASAENPKAAEAAGAALFRDKGCAYCHGANTQGTPKGPSLEKVRKTMKPDQIAGQIKNGGQKMPSFEDSLTSNEITQLVAYLRAKHRPAPPPPNLPTQN